MSKWITGGTSSANTVASGTTNYLPVIGQQQINTVEARVQMRVRAAFTASKLWANCTSFSGGNLTVRTRINGANGNQVLAINATGTFEDTTNTDSISSGDLVCISAVKTASGGATIRGASLLLDDGGSGTSIIGAFDAGGVSYTATSGLLFTNLSGSPSNSSEAGRRGIFRGAGTLSKFRIYVFSATNTATATFRTRVNGANGSQAISVTAGATGEFEDASNTDVLSAGDTVNFCKDSAANTGTIVLLYVTVHLTGGGAMLWGGGITRAYSTSGQTNYYAFYESPSVAITSESQAQYKARHTLTVKNAWINASGNSSSVAGTFDFRANGASPGSGPSISIGAGVTGLLEDTTGTYTCATTDLICLRFTNPAGTGSLSVTNFGVQQDVDASVALATAAFSTVYTMAATAKGVILGTSAFTTTYTLTASAKGLVASSAAFSSIYALSASAKALARATAACSTIYAMSATGSTIALATASFSNVFTLTTAPVGIALASAAAATTYTVTATAKGVSLATASFASTYTLAALARGVSLATASPAATYATSAQAQALSPASASFSTIYNLSASPLGAALATASFTTTYALSASPLGIIPASASFTADYTLSASPTSIALASVSFSTVYIITATATGIASHIDGFFPEIYGPGTAALSLAGSDLSGILEGPSTLYVTLIGPDIDEGLYGP